MQCNLSIRRPFWSRISSVLVLLCVAAPAAMGAPTTYVFSCQASGTLCATTFTGAQTTVTGTAGISLNLPANPSITDTLDGYDQTVNYSPVLGVIDASDSGAGWNLQISATTFSDGAGHNRAPGTRTAAAAHFIGQER